MRLLILTQKIDKNDSNLGFFHRWVEEFAKHCEQVIVICLFQGEHSFPKNVRVFSLGKEKGVSRLTYLYRFYSYIWKERKNYDSVFIHMNQIYAILGGLLWQAWNKRIALWYTHKSVSFSLWFAEKMVNIIFTASPESFRLKSKKVRVMGHGIDESLFPQVLVKEKTNPHLLSVGRISHTKGIDILIEAVEVLTKKYQDTKLVIVGAPLTKEDIVYKKELESLLSKRVPGKNILFAGGVSHEDTKKYYQEANVYLHASNTGSIDKVVLEALLSGLPVVSSSDAFTDMSGVIPVKRNPESFARGMEEAFLNGKSGREYVLKNHSLQRLIPKIVNFLSEKK